MLTFPFSKRKHKYKSIKYARIGKTEGATNRTDEQRSGCGVVWWESFTKSVKWTLGSITSSIFTLVKRCLQGTIEEKYPRLSLETQDAGVPL